MYKPFLSTVAEGIALISSLSGLPRSSMPSAREQSFSIKTTALHSPRLASNFARTVPSDSDARESTVLNFSPSAILPMFSLRDSSRDHLDLYCARSSYPARGYFNNMKMPALTSSSRCSASSAFTPSARTVLQSLLRAAISYSDQHDALIPCFCSHLNSTLDISSSSVSANLSRSLREGLQRYSQARKQTRHFPTCGTVMGFSKTSMAPGKFISVSAATESVVAWRRRSIWADRNVLRLSLYTLTA